MFSFGRSWSRKKCAEFRNVWLRAWFVDVSKPKFQFSSPTLTVLLLSICGAIDTERGRGTHKVKMIKTNVQTKQNLLTLITHINVLYMHIPKCTIYAHTIPNAQPSYEHACVVVAALVFFSFCIFHAESNRCHRKVTLHENIRINISQRIRCGIFLAHCNFCLHLFSFRLRPHQMKSFPFFSRARSDTARLSLVCMFFLALAFDV